MSDLMKPVPLHMAVHEAAHAVVALRLGGFAEVIDMRPTGKRQGGCGVSWPDDGQSRSREKLLTLAAGPAATALFRRCSQDEAIWQTGVGDLRRMQEIGDDGADYFKEARALCRRYWRDIMNLASTAQYAVVLTEQEINEVLEGQV